MKDENTLLAAYDDAAGVTAAFNKNILVRLNRELDADFDVDAFEHRAVWNEAKSAHGDAPGEPTAQHVRFAELDWAVDFAAGETIHTENSYKYRPEELRQCWPLPALPQRAPGATSEGGLRCAWGERRNSR